MDEKQKKSDVRKGHNNLAEDSFEFSSTIKCNISSSISASFGILIPKLIIRHGLCCDVNKLEPAWKTLKTNLLGMDGHYFGFVHWQVCLFQLRFFHQ